MAGPAAVTEEAPVLVGLYMTLEAVLAWLLERALLLIWIFTIGALLKALGNTLNYDKRFIHIHFGGPFLRLERDIHGWIVEQVLIQEYAIGWWWHQTARVQGWIAHELWQQILAVNKWGGWVVHTYLPTYVHGLTDILHTRTQTITKQVTVVTHKTTAITRDVVIPHIGELHWIHRHWKALTRAVAAAGAIVAFPPIAIPRIWDSLHDLKKWRTHVNKRLGKLEAAAGAAAFAALMANALGLGHNWRCITRGNIGRAARGLCRAPTWILDLLLLASFDAFAIADLCGLLKAEVKLAEWFQPLMMDLVDVDEWLIQNCDYDKAPALTLPAISLPSGRYGLTLNGARDVKLGLAG